MAQRESRSPKAVIGGGYPPSLADRVSKVERHVIDAAQQPTASGTFFSFSANAATKPKLATVPPAGATLAAAMIKAHIPSQLRAAPRSQATAAAAASPVERLDSNSSSPDHRSRSYGAPAAVPATLVGAGAAQGPHPLEERIKIFEDRMKAFAQTLREATDKETKASPQVEEELEGLTAALSAFRSRRSVLEANVVRIGGLLQSEQDKREEWMVNYKPALLETLVGLSDRIDKGVAESSKLMRSRLDSTEIAVQKLKERVDQAFPSVADGSTSPQNKKRLQVGSRSSAAEGGASPGSSSVGRRSNRSTPATRFGALSQQVPTGMISPFAIRSSSQDTPRYNAGIDGGGGGGGGVPSLRSPSNGTARSPMHWRAAMDSLPEKTVVTRVRDSEHQPQAGQVKTKPWPQSLPLQHRQPSTSRGRPEHLSLGGLGSQAAPLSQVSPSFASTATKQRLATTPLTESVGQLSPRDALSATAGSSGSIGGIGCCTPSSLPGTARTQSPLLSSHRPSTTSGAEILQRLQELRLENLTLQQEHKELANCVQAAKSQHLTGQLSGPHAGACGTSKSGSAGRGDGRGGAESPSHSFRSGFTVHH